MSTTIKVYDEALHRQVEEYMAAHKLSQEQMGVKLGRSGAAINQYLSRKYKGSVEKLDLDILARLCFVLHCQVGELLQYGEASSGGI